MLKAATLTWYQRPLRVSSLSRRGLDCSNRSLRRLSPLEVIPTATLHDGLSCASATALGAALSFIKGSSGWNCRKEKATAILGELGTHFDITISLASMQYCASSRRVPERLERLSSLSLKSRQNILEMKVASMVTSPRKALTYHHQREWN